MTYVRMIEDTNGDIVDIEHYCSASCFSEGMGEPATVRQNRSAAGPRPCPLLASAGSARRQITITAAAAPLPGMKPLRPVRRQSK